MDKAQLLVDGHLFHLTPSSVSLERLCLLIREVTTQMMTSAGLADSWEKIGEGKECKDGRSVGRSAG